MLRLLAWIVVLRDVITWAVIVAGVVIGLPMVWDSIAILATNLQWFE